MTSASVAREMSAVGARMPALLPRRQAAEQRTQLAPLLQLDVHDFKARVRCRRFAEEDLGADPLDFDGALAPRRRARLAPSPTPSPVSVSRPRGVSTVADKGFASR